MRRCRGSGAAVKLSCATWEQDSDLLALPSPRRRSPFLPVDLGSASQLGGSANPSEDGAPARVPPPSDLLLIFAHAGSLDSRPPEAETPADHQLGSRPEQPPKIAGDKHVWLSLNKLKKTTKKNAGGLTGLLSCGTARLSALTEVCRGASWKIRVIKIQLDIRASEQIHSNWEHKPRW